MNHREFTATAYLRFIRVTTETGKSLFLLPPCVSLRTSEWPLRRCALLFNQVTKGICNAEPQNAEWVAARHPSSCTAGRIVRNLPGQKYSAGAIYWRKPDRRGAGRQRPGHQHCHG